MQKFKKPKKLRDLLQSNNETESKENTNANTASSQNNQDTDLLSADIKSNEQQLKDLFQNCSDLAIRSINISKETTLLLVYIDGLIDTNTLEKVFLKPLIFDSFSPTSQGDQDSQESKESQGSQQTQTRLNPGPQDKGQINTIGYMLEKQLLPFSTVKKASKMSQLVDGILKENIGILVQGETEALLVELKGFEKRAIEEPQSEVTIRGPRDGFTETLRVNTTLIRRRIRTPKLKMESFTVGKLSKTDVVMAYIEGIAPNSLVEEVRSRINRIQLDATQGSEVFEEFMEDVTYSPFPQIQNTERPDVLTANILEGRVALLVDNTPFTLIMPMTFWSGLQTADDYYERFMYTTFIRFIRYVLFNISLFLPSLYVALSTYHPKLIPTNLLISVAAAREGVPFPAIIEALMMEFVFEGLREAGVRLPKAVGSAVSIVGALVIGQAAVQAGIVSAPMVIVVATTGIASFSIPRYNFGTAVRMIRFVMLVLAGMLGLYGIVLGFIALTIHLVNLRSFGVPYFTPVAPQIPSDLKDTIYRSPKWALYKRPTFISGKVKRRFPKGQKPDPQ